MARGTARPTAAQLAHAVARYEQGGTCKEIGLELGRSAQWVHIVLTDAGVKLRPRGSRPAELSPRWSGDNASYGAAHKRVVKARGKADHCVGCGASEGYFEWANLTGDYTNPDDYQSMCVPCHKKLDSQSPPRRDWASNG